MKLVLGGKDFTLCRTIIETSRAEQFIVVFRKVRCIRTIVEGAAVSYAWRKIM